MTLATGVWVLLNESTDLHIIPETEIAKFVFEHGHEITYLSFWGKWVLLPEWVVRCTQLRELHCSCCELTELPDWIGNLVQLRKLSCAFNNLVQLPDSIGNLVQLQELHCSHNQFAKLPDSIAYLVELRILSCARNKLTELPDSIGNLISLQTLKCWHNSITKLPDSMGNLIHLQKLDCSYNKLTQLPDSIGNLVGLQELDCSYNDLTQLPVSLYLLGAVHSFLFGGNPIEEIPPNVERWIERIDDCGNVEGQDVYNNTQNVHSTAVQNSLKRSIEFLFTLPETECDITALEISDDAKQLLQRYVGDLTVHSVLLVTYGEIFKRVVTCIRQLEHPETGYQRLEQELLDGFGLCFTGRITRLVNTLSGLHPSIHIQISRTEQISAIIIHMRNTFGEDNYKEHARPRLEELGLTEEEIGNWLDAGI